MEIIEYAILWKSHILLKKEIDFWNVTIYPMYDKFEYKKPKLGILFIFPLVILSIL